MKEFATFFKEIASQYEARAKSFSRVQSSLNETLHGDTFLSPTGGLAQTHKLLTSFHNDQRMASETARQIQLQIVQQLNAVRHDLGQKVKEIKNLSNDFKNNVDKEKEATRKSIMTYLDALSAVSSNSEAASKQDPFLVKMGVERQIRKLLAEENYLHKVCITIILDRLGSCSNICRRIKTLNQAVVNSRASWFKRSKRHSRHMERLSRTKVSPTSTSTPAWIQSSFRCQRIENGQSLSARNPTLFLPKLRSGRLSTFTTQATITLPPPRLEVDHWRESPSTSNPFRQDGLFYLLHICMNCKYQCSLFTFRDTDSSM